MTSGPKWLKFECIFDYFRTSKNSHTHTPTLGQSWDLGNVPFPHSPKFGLVVDEQKFAHPQIWCGQKALISSHGGWKMWLGIGIGDSRCHKMTLQLSCRNLFIDILNLEFTFFLDLILIALEIVSLKWEKKVKSITDKVKTNSAPKNVLAKSS